MSDRREGIGWLASRRHPRLRLLVAVGIALAAVGSALVFTAGPLGHGLGTVGLRAALLGLIVFAFAASGYVAFAVFEHGFE